jgi:rare lipoprotein A (peptidoglycan hydrolase)
LRSRSFIEGSTSNGKNRTSEKENPLRVNPITIRTGEEQKEGLPKASALLGPKKNFSDFLREQTAGNSPDSSAAEGQVYEYTVKPGDTLWKIGTQIFKEDPLKIAKDNGIANPNLIYPGQKLRIEKPATPSPQAVTASWYGKEYHAKPTASGEIFNMFQNTLAHKTLPLGTQVKLTNPVTGQMAIGRINDRGPFIKGRDVDLSYGLADKLGLAKKGVGKLMMEIL